MAIKWKDNKDIPLLSSKYERADDIATKNVDTNLRRHTETKVWVKKVDLKDQITAIFPIMR